MSYLHSSGWLLLAMDNKQLLFILMGVLGAFAVLVAVLSVIFITSLKKRAPVVKVVMAPSKDGEDASEQTAEQDEAFARAAEELAAREAAEKAAAEEEARRAAEEEAARKAAEEEARRAAEEEAARKAAEEESRRAAEEEAARKAAEEESRRAAEEEAARKAAEEEARRAAEEEAEEEDEEDDGPITEEEEELSGTHELAVSEISEATREALGLTEEDAVKNKRVTVRITYSFRAKLALSSDEVKAQYIELKNEIARYKKVKASISRKQERVYKGRTNLAYMLFRGKKLCIALALDPAEYAETKYRGRDVSAVKRFEKTPMLLKLTSARKVKYAKYLIEQLMLKNEIESGEPVGLITEVETATREELIERGEIVIHGVVTDDELPVRREEAVEQPPVQPAAEEEPVQAEESVAEEVPEEVYEETAAAAVEEQPVPEEAAEEPDVTPDEEEPVEEPVAEEPVVLVERDFEIQEEVDVQEAESFSDEEAELLVEEKLVKIKKATGKRKGIVNIDLLSSRFEAGDYVTLESLREKKLVAKDVNFVKILAKGSINKPLVVEADDFSLGAVKMLVLTGGRAIRRKITD